MRDKQTMTAKDKMKRLFKDDKDTIMIWGMDNIQKYQIDKGILRACLKSEVFG